MKNNKPNVEHPNSKAVHELNTCVNGCSICLRFAESSPGKMEHEIRRSLMECYAQRVEKWQ